MRNKRKSNSDSEEIRKKIKKLESKLQKKRRRIIYSESEDESECSNEGLEPTTNIVDVPSTSHTSQLNADVNDSAEPELDNEILAILGDAPKLDTKFGKPTHKDLASRWLEILQKGLPKELKEKLLSEYLIPQNCEMLVPPLHNAEVKVALADNMIKRDASLLAKQKQISVAIAAINQTIELIISQADHRKILKPASDACRLLCDSHFVDTKTRRGFVLSSINPELKDTLNEAKRDHLLFGENIAEKLKSTKSIKRSAADLKQINRSLVFNKNNFIKQNKSTNNRLNWKTVPRKIAPKTDLPRTHQAPSKRLLTFNSFQQRGQREAAERVAVPSTSRRR